MKAKVAIVGLLVLVLVMGAGNLLATYLEVHDSQATAKKAGIAVELKICTTMDNLAALQPPPGNPATNPSREFDDRLHATLDQLGADLGCGRQRGRRS